MFPLGLENLENGKAFSSEEILNSLKKVIEKHTKYWKISDKCYLIFVVIFVLTLYYLLKWITFSVLKKNIEKIPEKMEKILEKSGNFVSPEKWEPYECLQLYVRGNIVQVRML